MMTQEIIKDIFHITNNSFSGFILCNEQGIIYANPFSYRLLEYNPDDTILWDYIIPPNDIDKWCALIENVFLGLTIEYSIHSFVKKDGSIVTVEVNAIPYIADQNVYAQIHFRDVANDNKMSLKEQTDHYEMISKNISEVISQHTDDGTIVYLSPSVEHMTGYKPEKLIGKSPCDIIHPEDHNRVKYAFMKLIYTNQPQSVRFRIRTKQEQYKWMETNQKIWKKNKEAQIIVQTKLIEEQIQIEKMLLQTEKLATLGELGVGIVHEINNPLTSIKGFLQLMKAGTINIEDYLSILHSELNRIEKIASNLLSYAKPKMEKVKLDINDILNDVHMLMDIQATRKKIELNYFPSDEPLYTIGDETQLKQVFINIIKNAIEASDEGQQIHIEVQENSNYIYIHIIDSGVGIPNEKVAEIGQSSFTTKEKGTGVGLMVTGKILKEHQGEWSIVSQEGFGTTFKIKLPKFR